MSETGESEVLERPVRANITAEGIPGTSKITKIVTKGPFHGNIRASTLTLVYCSSLSGSIVVDQIFERVREPRVPGADAFGFNKGILVRGPCTAPIIINDSVAVAMIMATSFSEPIVIGNWIKGGIVAGENSTTFPATNDPNWGKIKSVQIGYGVSPPANPFTVSEWGLVGISDDSTGPAPSYRTIDEWLNGVSRDNDAKQGIIRAAREIAGDPATGTGLKVARVSRNSGGPGGKNRLARIESPLIKKLEIGYFVDGVVWSGDLTGLAGVPGVRDPNRDFAKIGDMFVGVVGPAASLYFAGQDARFQDDVFGGLFLPELKADERITISGKLGNSCCGCDNSPFPGNIVPYAEDSPRGAQCGTQSQINIRNPSGLAGQVVINSGDQIAEPETAWVGKVTVGSSDPLNKITIEPNASEIDLRPPYYRIPSGAVGGGAVGVVPFRLYEVDCEPQHLVRQTSTPALSANFNIVTPAAFEVGNVNSAEPVKIRFYGPIESAENESIFCSPLTNTATPTPNLVCIAENLWNPAAAGLFEVRYPTSNMTGIAARTVRVARAFLPAPTNDYAHIAPGLYRAKIDVRAPEPVVRTQRDATYWRVCTGASASEAFYFRVDNGTTTVNCLHCRADFNCSTAVTVQDVFDFLAAWFSNSLSADFNSSGGVTVQDIFDFLTAWFSGC